MRRKCRYGVRKPGTKNARNIRRRYKERTRACAEDAVETTNSCDPIDAGSRYGASKDTEEPRNVAIQTNDGSYESGVTVETSNDFPIRGGFNLTSYRIQEPHRIVGGEYQNSTHRRNCAASNYPSSTSEDHHSAINYGAYKIATRNNHLAGASPTPMEAQAAQEITPPPVPEQETTGGTEKPNNRKRDTNAYERYAHMITGGIPIASAQYRALKGNYAQG